MFVERGSHYVGHAGLEMREICLLVSPKYYIKKYATIPGPMYVFLMIIKIIIITIIF